MPNNQDQKRTYQCLIIVKTLSIQKKEIILKNVIEHEVPHIGKPTRILVNISTAALNARKVLYDVF